MSRADVKQLNCSVSCVSVTVPCGHFQSVEMNSENVHLVFADFAVHFSAILALSAYAIWNVGYLTALNC